MRTNKELLELAAKAAGLVGCEYVEETDFTHASMQRRNMGGPEDGFFELQADVWSPLTDDDDALRLAVKLEISINHFDSFVKAQAFYDGAAGRIVSALIDSDRLEATRRAIVRAASAIGEKL